MNKGNDIRKIVEVFFVQKNNGGVYLNILKSIYYKIFYEIKSICYI